MKFNGLIKWRKGTNVLEWSTREKDARTGKLVDYTEKAVFTKSGTQATNVHCQNRMAYFASQKQRLEQFQIVREVVKHTERQPEGGPIWAPREPKGWQ